MKVVADFQFELVSPTSMFLALSNSVSQIISLIGLLFFFFYKGMDVHFKNDFIVGAVYVH